MGMFDDLVPQGQASPKAGGMFADLIPAKPQEAEGPMSWSDVGSKALSNAPDSAMKFGHDIAQPFLHPIDTANNILDVGHGLAQKLGVSFDQDNPEDTAKANAVGKFFMDRYGSIENLKKTIATDPVGFAGDLSTVLTGGGGALARAPGIVGKVGEIAGAAGRIADPLNAVTLPAKAAGYLGREGLGLATGAGGRSVSQAVQAGLEGGEAADAFRQNMRGHAPIDDAVVDAKSAVNQMRQDRGSTYRAGMRDIGAIDEPIDFGKIDAAVWDSQKVKRYKGQNLSPTTDAIRQQMTDAIGNWRDLDPYEFHTPEGIDALKQKLGDMRDATQPHTPERVAANQIYGAVRQSIVDAAPQYARVMAGYEQASNLISEMERTLSINPKATIATTLGKLQKVLRDNVTTQYGKQAALADYLVANGAPNLMHKLAGQALSSWAPRGLNRLLATAAMEFHAPMTVAGAAALPMMSPRIVGETAHAAGRAYGAARPLGRAIEPARQIGRLQNPYQRNDQ